jgi:hypothetical protein
LQPLILGCGNNSAGNDPNSFSANLVFSAILSAKSRKETSMTIALPSLRVGEPVHYEGLSVFPLFTNAVSQVEYRVAEEALAGGSATVEEVSETGSVPELLVDNRGDIRLLLLEGEELRGAKQNRILNTSVLVAARTKLKIPVSCVEQGRWRYSDRHFRSSGHHATSKVRRAVKASVTESLKSNLGHRSDQGHVWQEVEMLCCAMEVESETAAMSAVFDACEDSIADFRDQLKYVDGASGMAVAIGGRVTSVDFFDKPATCARVWDRLLSGMVFDALEAKKNDRTASTADVERLLAEDFAWQPVAAVGEGSECRAESPRGDHASALVLDDVVVHGSIMAAE